MVYTIGEMAKMLGVPASTLRYYDKEGLLPFVALFLIGIGGELSDGQRHDGRAPDYDDWSTPKSRNERSSAGKPRDSDITKPPPCT